MSNLVISILVDNPQSWIGPYVEELVDELELRKHVVHFKRHYSKIEQGDIAFFLSCGEIVPDKFLRLNKYNLVVHESALPRGKGWSPLTWQILEGKNKIPITLFEAVEKVDAGRIYYEDTLVFQGHELIDELHDKQGKMTVEMCLRFVDKYPNVVGREQEGLASYYPRRKDEDSIVDADKTLSELFNNFRVADNERYPVIVEHKGYRYALKIEKLGEIIHRNRSVDIE